MTTSTVKFRTILWGALLTLLWVCCFLFISPTLQIQFGGGINASLKFVVAMVVLLIIVVYHLLDRPNPETTKLSLTTALTISWLALLIFYPFKDPANIFGGVVAFFALITGLAVVVLWVHFFADEIA